MKEDYSRAEKTEAVDGSFVSDGAQLNASALSQDLYGIDEEVDKEDDASLDVQAREIGHLK